jgi:hypothetical protein
VEVRQGPRGERAIEVFTWKGFTLPLLRKVKNIELNIAARGEEIELLT